MPFPAPEDIELKDEWFGAEQLWHDRPIIVRGRPQLREIAGHPRFSQGLNVIWKFEDDGESGMPSSKLDLEMTEFENQQMTHLERDNHAILAAVVTHAGEREWIFYCQDLNASAQRINEAFANEKRKPIELDGVDDPNWEEFLGIVQNFTSL